MFDPIGKFYYYEESIVLWDDFALQSESLKFKFGSDQMSITVFLAKQVKWAF